MYEYKVNIFHSLCNQGQFGPQMSKLRLLTTGRWCYLYVGSDQAEHQGPRPLVLLQFSIVQVNCQCWALAVSPKES